MGIQTAVDAVTRAERIVEALHRADDLAFEASRVGGPRTLRVLASAAGGDDQLLAVAAVHAAGRVVDERADSLLAALLSSAQPHLVEHAAWALGSRRPVAAAVPRLVGLVAAGGFTAMIAQRTLEQWATHRADLVGVALESALVGVTQPGARRGVVETLGLVPGPATTPTLLRISADASESPAVRASAVGALGERRGEPGVAALVSRLAEDRGQLAEAARLALVDLMASPDADAAPRDGLAVGQLALHADVDPGLTEAGRGATGGIATLLVRLGDAMVAPPAGGGPPAVDRVLTMSRGTAAEALRSVHEVASTDAAHRYGRVSLAEAAPDSAGATPEAGAALDAWSHRVAARRGVRRLLRAVGGLDVLHLRMADVGSLVAAEVAYDLDVPVVFTLAPDPPAVIETMDLAGRLHRGNFGEVDLREHYWFRTRLVQRLAGNAAHTVLFPRPELARDTSRLLAVDLAARPERHTVVPEGIDLELSDLAASEAAHHAAGGAPSPDVERLRELLRSLPPDRQGLPLVVTVGRLHRVKGMAAVVRAWHESALSERANLLLVGGDLVTPGPDERDELDRVDALVPPGQRAAAGLLLAGHRANGTVARWLAAAREGVPGLAAPRGIYVCGSVKEEFGLALLEAMAAGLLVVAPEAGGPATYVEQGVTGWLTRTWDPGALARAVTEAFAAAQAETTSERATRSRATVADRFTVQAMARTLAGVYRDVADEHRDDLDRLAATG